jgi:hypothetical protein
MTYMRAFLKFRISDAQNMFNNFDGNNAKGTPHSKLISQHQGSSWALKRNFKPLKALVLPLGQ